MPLASGTRLGPYEILSAIGAGGMGEGYKARDTRLDLSVAIKVLPPDVSADPDRRTRFEREAKTIAGLSHPHIFEVLHHDVSRGRGRAPPRRILPLRVTRRGSFATFSFTLVRLTARIERRHP